MLLFDAHLHVFSKEPDIPDDGFFCINAAEPAHWPLVAACAAEHDTVRGFAGVHPCFTGTVYRSWDTDLEALLIDNPDLGVGEIGLDARKQYTAVLPEQEALLSRQLGLAAKHKRPVSLHCVRAYGRLIPILREHLPEFGTAIRGIVHWFAGGDAQMKALLEMGLHISFHPTIHTADPGRKALLRRCPPERLLLETDSETGPDIATLKEHYSKTAVWLGMPVEKLQQQVMHNGTLCTN